MGEKKKAQKASLDMYDRLEKEFKASSQEWRWKEGKERVDRVHTILKEDPELHMWEHREYMVLTNAIVMKPIAIFHSQMKHMLPWQDLMLFVSDCQLFKSSYQGLRINRNPVW